MDHNVHGWAVGRAGGFLCLAQTLPDIVVASTMRRTLAQSSFNDQGLVCSLQPTNIIT